MGDETQSPGATVVVDSDVFRDALRNFPAGVTIVTAADASGALFGATVSAFASLSLDPPLVLVCLTRSSRSTAAIRERGAYVVHFLDQRQATLARRFATDSADKFADTEYSLNDDGVPCLDDCSLLLECKLQAEYDGGDHLVLVGLVTSARRCDEFEPLVYAKRSFHALGSQVG